MGLLLYIISYLIEPFAVLINFITVLLVKRKQRAFIKTVDNFFFYSALSRDKFCNYNYRTGLNYWFIKKDKEGHKFGNSNETISSALGKNYLYRSLSISGYTIYYILYAIDYSTWKKGGHCIASIVD